MSNTLKIKDFSIPSLGFGTFKLNGESCHNAVKVALDAGYRHIDTAQIYENEEEVGAAIKESGVSRQDLWLTTKVWFRKAKAKEVRASTLESLKKLQTDHVDLLLFHWPNNDVPMEETLGEMARLKDEGKARAIGVSNFTSTLLKQALECAPIICNQVEFHPRLDQRLLLGMCQKHDLMLTAYSPLAQAKILKDDEFLKLAAEAKIPPAELSLAWLLRKDKVAAIPRSSSEENIRANFRARDHVIDESLSLRIDALMGDQRMISPDFSPAWDAPL